MSKRAKHPSERFWDKVVRGEPHECWEWTGATQVGGYGFMWAGPLYHQPAKRWVLAHRVSWEIENGPVPAGGCILHHCDNPPCVNPAHLYLGTKADNARDRGVRKRGKESRQQGEANDNAKLSEAQARAVLDALREIPRRSQLSIAVEFGISQPQVSRISRGTSWRHLWE